MAPIGATNQLALLAKPLNQPTAGAPSNVLGGAAVMANRSNMPMSPVNTASAGGNTGGQTYDAYSQYGGKAAYDSMVSGFNAQKDNIYGTARDAVGNAAISINSSILDLVDALKRGQGQIDNQAVQTELAKKQGTRGVLGMVGRGIQSGGVMLGNKNAASSSGAEGIARAYSDIGRRELSNVGNQYELGMDQVAQSQADLEMQRASGVRKIGENKTMVVNSIVSEARNKLAALDGQIAGASLPNRINIEAEKEAIKAQALQQLQQYDQQLATGVGGVQASSADARRGRATELANKGTAPENAFDFNTQTPAEFQNTGPFSSGLPLFLSNRSKRTQ